MLKHEDNPQTQPLPAAQVRVTPEELAAAITVLQIRKEGQPGTIAIGDAVEELGVDATPEEVLAEVQAQRQAIPLKRRARSGRRLVVGFSLVGMLLGFMTIGLRFHSASTAQSGQSISIITDTSTLDDVSDNQPFYVNTHGLEQIVSGDAPASIHVYHRIAPGSTYATSDWHLIKHGETVYVQAYTVQTSEKQIRSEATLNLYNREDISLSQHPDIGSRLLVNGKYFASSRITLPITNSTLSDTEQMDAKARVTITAQPDSHLWDNF